MTLPVTPRLAFSELPVIDLEPLLQDPRNRPCIGALDRACRDPGFFYVKNHGVESGLVDALYRQAKLFFARPQEEKNRVMIDACMRGYLPPGYRSYEGEARAGTSHQEGFWIGHERQDHPDHPLEGPNQWPGEHLELKSAMLAYLQAVEGLSRVLARAFASALGLGPGDLIPLFDNPTSRLKLNHYPPQDNPAKENEIGVVPHCDSGAFTILWQDHHGGLEIQKKDGHWAGAPPVEGTFVVNLGHIMQVWSNHRFSSTPHRVINRGGNDRYSIPFFVNPNPMVRIRPLVPDGAASSGSFMYGEYQLDQWRRTFPIANIP
ncbi:MAG: hypothetical protein OXG56_02340 [Gammaproteobacteria bacterium]|nr:hypothetical protein [Gammaproteobacteria bacterium]